MTMQMMFRRAFLAISLLAATAPLLASPAAAATNPAEQYVTDNIHRGLDILNDKALPAEQKRVQFEQFLLGLTDMKRIAVFTLGNYRRSASQADQDAFTAAFQNYAVAVYQSYFAKYAGQTLKVTGSQERAADDVIVQTVMIDPNDHSGQPPAQVQFRVRRDNAGKPVVVDVAYSGLWLSLEERDQFTAFLGQNNGNIRALVSDLNDRAKAFK